MPTRSRAQCMIDDFHAHSCSLDGAIDVRLDLIGDACVALQAIENHGERGRGHAHDALVLLTALADKWQVMLELVPRRLDDDGVQGAPRAPLPEAPALHTGELEAWYARFGFIRSGGFSGAEPVMIREAGGLRTTPWTGATGAARTSDG
jgi:hypothetical protein